MFVARFLSGTLADVAFAAFAVIELLAALVLLHIVYAAWVRRAHPARGARLEAGGFALHAVRRGRGRAVALVHGANGVAADFPEALVADLERDHEVFAFDRPGHGWSGRGAGPLDLEANARAIVAALRGAGDARAVVVGHSYGAAVALRAALDAPDVVAGVVAVAPCTQVDERNRFYTRWAPPGGALGLALLHVAALPLVMPAGPALRREAWHPVAPPPGWAASRAWALVPSQMQVAGENFRHLPADVARLALDLPRLVTPLVVLVGADDRITPWRVHAAPLAERIAGARLDVIEGCGHWLPRQRPGRIAEAVRTLLAAL